MVLLKINYLRKQENEFPPKCAFLAKKQWKIINFYVIFASPSQNKPKNDQKMIPYRIKQRKHTKLFEIIRTFYVKYAPRSQKDHFLIQKKGLNMKNRRKTRENS